MACDGCRDSSVALLLEAGADPNVKSLGSLTPLHVACRNDCVLVVKVLLSRPGVDVDVETSERAMAEMLTKNEAIIDAIISYRSRSPKNSL